MKAKNAAENILYSISSSSARRKRSVGDNLWYARERNMRGKYATSTTLLRRKFLCTILSEQRAFFGLIRLDHWKLFLLFEYSLFNFCSSSNEIEIYAEYFQEILTNSAVDFHKKKIE